MKPKTLRALPALRTAPRPHDLAQRLRRIRNEVSLMLAAIEEGLQRIETPETETAAAQGDQHGS